MATGVTFWQLADDQDRFFRYLMQKGSVFAFPHFEAVADLGLIRAEPIEQFLLREFGPRLYITPQKYATHPTFHAFPPSSSDQSVLYTLSAKFPALVYTPGSLKDGVLSQSNASAYTCYIDDEAQVIHKMPADFLLWLRQVTGWLRRATPEWHSYRGYRVTKAAAEAALSGLQLLPYHGWGGQCTGKSSFMPGAQPVGED